MLCLSCPVSPAESGIPSSWCGTRKECIIQSQAQPGMVQSMYCQELVLGGDIEFSFEELRAQRYYQQLNGMVQQHLVSTILSNFGAVF